ncbi:hypothetical protein [Actinoplanes sp. NPDC051851]|uniref:hypothetical protein n=1 Tax=Actinoplanes sp. NPDC051851 TaxID=3154753 RepID=UPI0034488ABB
MSADAGAKRGQQMGGDNTDIDLLSLEDFYRTLDSRLSEANAAVSSLTNSLKDRSPALGSFQDASKTATRYDTLYDEHLDRAKRLVSALTAAKTATSTILSNYRTTEARNHADAKDIASVLNSVGTELNGDEADA